MARQRRPVGVAGGAELTPATTVGDSGAYSPAYLQSAYNAPSATAGSGQTVAVVDPFDSTTLSSDLAGYRSHYGLPPCTTASGCFRKVDQGGGTSYPAADASWAQEISLDLDMVSALCPHCNILLVEANSTAVSDVGTAVNTAVALGANVVSNSYSAAEYPTEMNDSAAFYHHPGVAIVAASGDVGYGAAFPAISSDAVAVGGTTLNQSSNGGSRNATETAWSGGGSGCSSYVAKPSWQHDSSCAARIGVDVSAVADPNTGVWVYTGGQWAIYGGTSAAAPIVAAMYALAGNAVTAGAQPASYPYLHHGALNDVVSGSNGTCSVAYFCTAGPGYDGPTGLGTPNTAAAFQSGVAPGVTVVAAAGSVTTQAVMSSLAANSYGGATTPFYNIPADFTLAGVTAYTVPGESNSSCPEDTVWSPDPLGSGSTTPPTEGVAPFGTVAGEKYLRAEDNATGTGPNANSGNPPASTGAGTDSGCVSVARSALPPGTSSDGTDRIGFEYDAFGLDAVSWASSSLRAPATLTQAQLLGIYNCTFTDWRQVGGAPGSIQRYLPPAGSETRLFFATDILNQSATYMPPTGVAGCPDPVVIDENEGQQVRATDSDSAIMPYAASAWDLQQSNSLNPSLDWRVNTVGAVQLLHGITTAAPAPGAPLIASPVKWNSSNHDYELDTAGPVVESNVRVNLAAGATPAYPGIRYVYSVLNRNVTTNSTYAAAESLFGFDNSSPTATTKSPMCSNQGPSSNQVLAVNAIWSGGFASLSTTGGINGNNRAGATCRQFLVTS